MVEMKPYKLEGVRFPVRLEELIDISILHPFRYHHELGFIHGSTQKRQHIWMVKSAPCDNLLAESLQGVGVSRSAYHFSETLQTHARDLVNVAI